MGAIQQILLSYGSKIYLPLTTSWRDNVDSTPSILDALNVFEAELISIGLSKFDKPIYPFVGGTSTKHSYNFMNVATNQLTFNGGFTHSANGVLPNGTNAYATCGLTNLDVNTTSESVFHYSRTDNNATNQIDLGVNSSNIDFTLVQRHPTGVAYSHINCGDSEFVSSTVSNSLGFVSSDRNGATQKILKNGVSLASNTPTFTTPISRDIYLFAQNLDAVAPAFYALRESAFIGFAKHLTDAEHLTFYNAVQALQTSLGRQV